MAGDELPETCPGACIGGVRVWTDGARPLLRRGWVWMSGFAGLVLAIEAFEVPLFSVTDVGSMALSLLAVGILFLTPIVALIGALVFVVACLRAVARSFARPSDPAVPRVGPKELLRAGLWRFALACFPLGVFLAAGSVQLGKRVHLALHRTEFEAVVRGEPEARHAVLGVDRYGDATMLYVSGYGLTDAYWLVHDPCGDPRTAHPELWRVELLRHLEGPWFSMVH